jgi:predicted enzyme related to lactoylglutathione lyase
MPPTFANGKICYVEIPAVDIARSADFYEKVFGWHVRRRGDGSVAFDDGVEEVSGTWVLGRPPAATVSLMIHIMVDSLEGTVKTAIANGAELVRPIGADAPEITAWIKDPAGNVIGLYQHRGSQANS